MEFILQLQKDRALPGTYVLTNLSQGDLQFPEGWRASCVASSRLHVQVDHSAAGHAPPAKQDVVGQFRVRTSYADRASTRPRQIDRRSPLQPARRSS